MLHLQLKQATIIHIGASGEVRFAEGDYLYVGSAFGPGGVRARLSRHLQGKGNMHWHIDALRGAAHPVGGCYFIPTMIKRYQPPAEEMPLWSFECRWSQALAALPEVSAPVPGFGASDCRSRCISHLLMIDPSRSLSVIDGLLLGLAETLAESINIEAADLHCIQPLSARGGHS